MPDMALDPGKGFVALPLDLFDLDLTPGAFRTLAEFCRMANADGVCWPSLGQLAERLGRSRAAISGYIAELRDTGLLTTETQRTATGFNYRLRYHLPFWAQWKRRFGRSKSASADQSTERRVQPTERPKEIQNQSHKNHEAAPPAQPVSAAKKLLQTWQRLVGSVAYPGFADGPSPALLAETRSLCAAQPNAAPPASASDLAATFAAVGVDLPEATAQHFADMAQAQPREMLSAAIRDGWQPHWRRPPSPTQFAQFVEMARWRSAETHVVQLLQTYLRRASLAGFALPEAAGSPKTISEQAKTAPLYPRI